MNDYEEKVLEASVSSRPAIPPGSGTGMTTRKDNDDRQTPSLKILVAEDDAISRLYISKALSKIGHTVFTAKDGNDVLKILKLEDSFDVLLTDIQMPGLDGIELTRILRSVNHFRQHAHLPVIAITAYGTHGDRERCLKVGIDEYLPKPIDTRLLQIILNRFTNKMN